MNAMRIEINRRGAIALLLAAVIMTMAATPALAWEPEGDGRGQARHAVVVSRAARNFSSRAGIIRLASPADRTLKRRPSLARAE